MAGRVQRFDRGAQRLLACHGEKPLFSFSPSHNRWNAVGGKLHVLPQVESVDGLDQADTAHLKEIVHALAPVREALHDAEHQPQIAGDQLLPRFLVARPGLFQKRPCLAALQDRQRGCVHAADLNFPQNKTPLPYKEWC